MSWVRKTISIDANVWEESRNIVKQETGMTISRFVEIYLRGVVRAKKGRLLDVVEGATRDLIEMDDSTTIRKKQSMNLFIDDNKENLLKISHKKKK